MRLLASALDEAGPRGFVWAVLAGLVLGGILIAHAGLAIARAFPEDVRANAVAAVKRRPRLAVVAVAVTAWTLVYLLYSLAYPSSAASVFGAGAPATPTAAVAERDEQPVAVSELLTPSLGGELAIAPEPSATVTPDAPPAASTPSDEPAPATTTTTTTTAPPPAAEPCPFEAVAEAFGPDAAAVLCPEGTAP
jgi:hypothetical protein